MSNIRRTAAFTPEMGARAIEEAVTGNSEFRKFKVGDNFIRFFPALLSEDWQEGMEVPKPYRLIYQHWLKDLPGAPGPIMFICPRLMSKKPCDACTQADTLSKSGNPVDREEAKEIWQARQQALWIGLDRENEHLGPGIFPVSPKLHKKICSYSDSRKGGDFTDVVNGFDMIVTKTEKGDYPEYDAVPCRESSPLAATEEEINAYFDILPDLDKHTVMLSDTDILAKIGTYLRQPTAQVAAPSPRAALQAPVQRPQPVRAQGIPAVPSRPVVPSPARPRAVPPPVRRAQDAVKEMVEGENGEWGLSDKETPG